MKHSKHQRLLAGLLSIVMMFSLFAPAVSAAPADNTGTEYTYYKLPQTVVTGSTASSAEQNGGVYNEGPASMAFDGNLGTAWHSDYNAGAHPLPQSIEWTLDDTYQVGRIEYQKKNGGNNGIWKNIKVEGKTTGDWFELAIVNDMENVASTMITFEPKAVSALKVTVYESHNSSGGPFASAGEIITYSAVSADTIIHERIPQAMITDIVPSSEQTTIENTPAKNAFDNELGTFWHSSWGDNTPPHTIEWCVGEAKQISSIEYVKRPNKGNGDWQKVTVEGKNGGESWTILTEDVVIPADVTEMKIKFTTQPLTHLKVTIKEGQGGFASASEIYTYQAVKAGSVVKRALRTYCQDIEALKTTGYTEASIAEVTRALAEARKVLSSDAATDENCRTAEANLKAAVKGLTVAESSIEKGGASTGNTKDQPFAKGTAGSNQFRIPSIITLKHQTDEKLNGRLVAAIDARWNHTGDACSLDTILSVSDNNGTDWTYSFPNFFNDSTNQKAANGTAFIDPVMVEAEDGTIYMMVDLFPGGVAINTAPRSPANDSGYRLIHNEQRMVLYTGVGAAQTAENYAYYVGEFTEMNGKQLAPVLAKDAALTDEAAYYVDEHYYLYDAAQKPLYCRQIEGGNVNGDKFVHQNVFFYNAELHVRDAAYLWVISSKDGGKSWSVPTILNGMVRKTQNADKFYGVGPGAGLSFVDAQQNNVILLEAYTFSTQITSFVYTTDKGATWHRAPDATKGNHWSSESALVQIDATTVRQFYRDGENALNYTDYTWNPDTQKFTTNATSVAVPGASKTYNNQLSAIEYSQPVDGRKVYLVSTADGGEGNRSHGRIYVLGLNQDENKTMKVLNTIVVNEDKYGYSSLTETKEHDIALLFEGKTVDNRYGEDIYFQIIPKEDLSNKLPEQDVELKVGETQKFEIESDQAPVVDNDQVVKAEIVTETTDGVRGLIGTDNHFNGGSVAVETALLDFAKQDNGGYRVSAQKDNQTIYMQIAASNSGYPMMGTTTDEMDLVAVSGTTDKFLIKNQGSERVLYFWRDGKAYFDALGSVGSSVDACSFMLYRPVQDNETSSTELPGYVKVSNQGELANGKYLIVAEYQNTLFVLRPATDSDKNQKFNYVMKIALSTATKKLALTGLTVGTAKVETADKIYNVNVTTDLVNLALNKTGLEAKYLDGTNAAKGGDRPLTMAVDGTKNNRDGNYAEFGADGNNNPAYFQVDLGQLCDIDHINLYRYWDNRVYKNTVVAIADNPEFTDAKVIFNADTEQHQGMGEAKDQGYPETAQGHTFPVKAQGRYVRVYMDGTANGRTNHINEIEVFGKVAPVVVEKVTATFKNGNDVVKTTELDKGSALGTLPTAPAAPADKEFKGWKNETTNEMVTAATTIDQDTTYVAVFGLVEKENRSVRFFAYVDGKLTLIDSRTLTTYWIDSKHRIPASVLAEVYADFGFRATDLKAGEKKFLHANKDEPSIWAESAIEFEGTVYASTLNQPDKTAIDVVYLPKQTVSGSVGRNDTNTANNETFYTVTSVNGTQYFLNNTDAVVTMAGKGWVMTDAQGVAVPASYDEAENQTTFTVKKIAKPYTVSGEFYGTSMRLNSDLQMQFYVEKSKLPENTDGIYAMITKAASDTRALDQVKVPFADWTYVEKDRMYYVDFKGVAAKEMMDKFTVQVFDAEDRPLTAVRTDSIHDYAVRMIRKPSSTPALKTLLVDMLNYGAEAQKQFKYDVANLANADLTAEEQELATKNVPLTAVPAENVKEYAGTAPALNNNIRLSMYFNGTSEGLHAVVTYNDHYNQPKTEAIRADKFDTSWDGHYGVNVDTLAVADFAQMVKIEVFKGEELVASATDSIANYAGRMNEQGGIYEAMVKFGTSSSVYFAQK